VYSSNSVSRGARHRTVPVAISAPIPKSLEDASSPTSTLDRHLAREETINSSQLSMGNGVRLLQDGPETYTAMLAAITAAKDHINMETYILDDDAVGNRFADALIAKQLQGVQVNLIHDSVGTIGTSDAFFGRLKQSGVRVLEFNPVNPVFARTAWNLNQRDHRKLLIVDGRIAFLGGINISSVYSGGSSRFRRHPSVPATPVWRDTDLQLSGPVVEELQKLFLDTWRSQRGEPLPAGSYFPAYDCSGDQVVRVIGSSPEEPASLMWAALLSAIDNADISVHLTNAYFVPAPQLLTALKCAVARGVVVRLILPGQSDSWLVFHAGRSFYAELLRAGVEIHERQEAILHAKTTLIDGVWATVGSTNLDWRSLLHNYELDAVVLGADFGSQVQSMFDKDLARSKRVLLDEWEARQWTLRVREFVARLWEYWL
jgi:cardiolipin synthase A/B